MPANFSGAPLQHRSPSVTCVLQRARSARGPIDGGKLEFIPLNRWKKSPRNARKTPHSAEDVAALAASIAAHGMLQPRLQGPHSRRRARGGFQGGRRKPRRSQDACRRRRRAPCGQGLAARTAAQPDGRTTGI
ncbi:ParB N-terminal domain-containing protein [Bradyrhizobium genosp. P]|uniref:ParB N-terminal domain-containing protein n=1 Tax=Bradyrhizobium genosp. P TaxID=83641 RepID=UPI003CE7195D